MVVRTKGAEYRAWGVSALLGLLGAGQGAAGRRKVAGEAEVIASVPFRLNTEDGSNGVPWTFSTFDLDRLGERVDPRGWDYAQYPKNPVVEWAHRYDIPAIGRADNLYAADGDVLHGLVVFNDKGYDPFGWAVGERVRRGVIRAGSVGFRILEIEIPSKEDGGGGFENTGGS
jgi:hypothetical protein